ncbi:hypothetical protein HPULCUR_002971 [Helicostylum pulchrum]|uniref:Uncharacterized protein n=1 Tax=Helicostylum pulchrum TaxID=562976 RepID=A0ABP9XT52_9FUNG
MALDFSFITRVDLFDKTFASIEKKLLRQPQINEWRIDVAPSHTDEMNAACSSTSMLLRPALPTPPTAPVALLRPPPNPSAQSCQFLIQRQAQKIKELTEKSTVEQNIMKSIYMLRREEERLRYLNEISIRDTQLKMLNKKVASNNQFINDIESIEIQQDDREKDKEMLLLDKVYLMRKLKIAELRLQMQQVEINALRGSDNPSKLETSFYFAHKPPLITQRDSSPEKPTFHQDQNDISPQNQTITRESTSPIPSAVQRKPDQTKIFSNTQTSAVPRLSTLAIGLLKSTQQSNQVYTIQPSSSNPCIIETSPTSKKRKATTDNDKKLKSIKLTYKSQWTIHEDQLLFDKVNSLGTDDWKNISRFLPCRSSSECFLRYKKISATN